MNILQNKIKVWQRTQTTKPHPQTPPQNADTPKALSRQSPTSRFTSHSPEFCTRRRGWRIRRQLLSTRDHNSESRIITQYKGLFFCILWQCFSAFATSIITAYTFFRKMLTVVIRVIKIEIQFIKDKIFQKYSFKTQFVLIQTYSPIFCSEGSGPKF